MSSKSGIRRWFLGCSIALALGTSMTGILVGLHPNIDGEKQRKRQRQRKQRLDRKAIDPNAPILTPISRNRQKNETQTIIQDGFQDGEYITNILLGKEPFPERNTSTTHRLKFQPGTLLMSRAQSLQYCFVNTTHYQHHLRNSSFQVSYSDKYQFIYRNVPKSSSSTGRSAVVNFFEGNDKRLKAQQLRDLAYGKNYSVLTFVREPLDRFYSAYDEAYYRMGPWMGDGPLVEDKPKVKKMYHENKYKVEKYPYLYEGMEDLLDFYNLYCPEEILKTRKFTKCNDAKSVDDGSLARRFEQFVKDYSGLDPFDIHLSLQVSFLVDGITGTPYPITRIYNSSEADKEWIAIAQEKGVENPEDELEHGRKIMRRFNMAKVSAATKRKICRMIALDYCCLNFELPDVCKSEVGDEGIFCAMERRPVQSTDFIVDQREQEIEDKPGKRQRRKKHPDIINDDHLPPESDFVIQPWINP